MRVGNDYYQKRKRVNISILIAKKEKERGKQAWVHAGSWLEEQEIPCVNTDIFARAPPQQ